MTSDIKNTTDLEKWISNWLNWVNYEKIEEEDEISWYAQIREGPMVVHGEGETQDLALQDLKDVLHECALILFEGSLPIPPKKSD